MITRNSHPAGVLFLLLALSGARPALAQWTTQSFVLQAGWNAIYTHVAASTNLTLRQLIEADTENPIDKVWLWKPDPSKQQFVTSPAEPAPTSTQWRSWERGRSDTGDNTLQTLPGNAAFLVHVPSRDTAYTWKVVGKPVPPRFQWTTSGLNFLGFPTPASAPPSWKDFLAGQPALRNSAEVFQYSGDELPSQVFGFASVPVRRGEAFWVRSGDFFNRYFGPFEVILQDNEGVHFGKSGGQYRIRLRNLSPRPVQVVTTYASGEAPIPAGEDPIQGRPTLLVRGPRSSADLTYGYSELTGPVTNNLAAYGTNGFEAEIILGVDRVALTGNPTDLFAGILTLKDLGGLSQVELPVTAQPASLGGLWVGSALVTQVRHYLQTPVRGLDGQNASDASPVFVPSEVSDVARLAEAVGAAATPFDAWLGGQLSSATRLELAYSRGGTLGEESIPSSKFGVADIADLHALADRLTRPAVGDGVAIWFRSVLPASTLEMLKLYGSPKLDPRLLRAALVDALNGAVVGPRIHDPVRFQAVTLSPDTQGLLDQTPPVEKATLARLNRRLLDDAFPRELIGKPDALRNTLTADLNRILAGPLIFRADRFQDITLSSDTLRLVDEQPRGDALAYLNRLLLEQALAGMIAPNSRQYAFRTSDLRSLDSVVDRLKARQADDFYGSLWDTGLLPETRSAVDAHGTPNGDPSRLAALLVADLDAVIRSGSSIYTTPRFEKIALSTETQALRAQNPTGADLVKLNRMLLEDAFPAAIAPSYGRVLVTQPRQDFGSVARPFPLRLILHNDPDPDSGGVSLLQRVYLGNDDQGGPMVATLESLLSSKYLSAARRISAPHLPWSKGNTSWPLSGKLTRSAVLTTTRPVVVAYDDQAANPFLHTYHPDHDNRNALHDEELPRGEESYGVQRVITLTFREPGADFDARTVGSQTLTGEYGEVLTLQGRQHPDSGRPDEVRTLEVRGGFALQRIQAAPTLTKP